MNKPPNILLFLTDDHGHWTLPFYGNRCTRTPALTRLCENGVLFTSAFTPSPVCSPARASLLTGRMPSAHGIHDWIPEGRDRGRFPHIDGMEGNLAQRFKALGYETAYVGKYHCNHAGANPLGFDFWFTHKPPFDYTSRCPQAWHDNENEVTTEGYHADVITEAALRYLKTRDNSRPFLLVIGHTGTHAPHCGEREEFYGRFRSMADLGLAVEPFSEAHGRARFLPPVSPEAFHEQCAQYLAAVEAVDHEVGRTMQALADQGCLAGTHIVYTSDHGHMNGHHGLHTKGNATVPVNFLEESIRVPLIVAGPGIRRDARSAAFVDHCDLYATLLDLAGFRLEQKTADGAALPGRSFLPILRGEAGKSKPYQCCEYGNARMIRTGQYKLIRRYAGPNGQFPDELYDLERDPWETRNRFNDPSLQTVVRGLSHLLDGFFQTNALDSSSGLSMDLLARLHSTSCWNVDPVRFPVIHQ